MRNIQPMPPIFYIRNALVRVYIVILRTVHGKYEYQDLQLTQLCLN